MTVLARQIVCEAESWLGTVEVPLGANKGGRVDEINKAYFGNTNSYPWCTSFVWVVYDRAVRALGGVNRLPGNAEVGGNAKRTFQIATERFTMNTTPAIGSIFYRRSTDPSDTAFSGHMGVVVGMDDDTITTIEGNQGETHRVGKYTYTRGELGDWQFRFIHVEDESVPATQVTSPCAPQTASTSAPTPADVEDRSWAIWVALGIGAIVLWRIAR